MNHKFKKLRKLKGSYPKNGFWSRMVHAWWLRWLRARNDKKEETK